MQIKETIKALRRVIYDNAPDKTEAMQSAYYETFNDTAWLKHLHNVLIAYEKLMDTFPKEGDKFQYAPAARSLELFNQIEKSLEGISADIEEGNLLAFTFRENGQRGYVNGIYKNIGKFRGQLSEMSNLGRPFDQMVTRINHRITLIEHQIATELKYENKGDIAEDKKNIHNCRPGSLERFIKWFVKKIDGLIKKDPRPELLYKEEEQISVAYEAFDKEDKEAAERLKEESKGGLEKVEEALHDAGKTLKGGLHKVAVALHVDKEHLDAVKQRREEAKARKKEKAREKEVRKNQIQKFQMLSKSTDELPKQTEPEKPAEQASNLVEATAQLEGESKSFLEGTRKLREAAEANAGKKRNPIHWIQKQKWRKHQEDDKKLKEDEGNSPRRK